jgi:hypothetical protein
VLFDPGIKTELLIREREILRDIAALGNDCVIIGRDADVILEDCRPFRVFACADIDARLRRCMKHELKRPETERLTERQVLCNIRRIDRNRRNTREILTGKSHADGSAFDPEGWYNVAMTSYRASGGGDILIKGAGLDKDEIEERIVARHPEIRELVYRFFKEHGTVDAALTGDRSRIGEWHFVPEKTAGPMIEKDLDLIF